MQNYVIFVTLRHRCIIPLAISPGGIIPVTNFDHKPNTRYPDLLEPAASPLLGGLLTANLLVTEEQQCA